MSHEIRTPMNGVVGMVDILQQTELTAETKTYARNDTKFFCIFARHPQRHSDFSKIEAVNW